MLGRCTLPLLCGTAFALAGCIEGLPAEAGDGSADRAVADHSHETVVTEASPPGDLYPPPLIDVGVVSNRDLGDDVSIADLQAALDEYVQAISAAGIALCPCLANLESPACLSDPSRCFTDDPTCRTQWTFSQPTQTCVLEVLTPHANTAVTALECMGTAARTLATCVDNAECTKDFFPCLDAYEQTNVPCMMALGLEVINEMTTCSST